MMNVHSKGSNGHETGIKALSHECCISLCMRNECHFFGIRWNAIHVRFVLWMDVLHPVMCVVCTCYFFNFVNVIRFWYVKVRSFLIHSLMRHSCDRAFRDDTNVLGPIATFAHSDWQCWLRAWLWLVFILVCHLLTEEQRNRFPVRVMFIATDDPSTPLNDSAAKNTSVAFWSKTNEILGVNID